MDWVERVLLALGGAGFLTVASRAYTLIYTTRHKTAREVRKDEIDILHESIAELRTDRDSAKNALSELRSEHTACLLRQEELKASNRWLNNKVKEMEARILRLEQK